MDTFNLCEAAEKSLELLKNSGASVKTVRGYLTTGFGAAVRHFTSKGDLDVDSAMLDEFVRQQYECFEHGEFSQWKWRLVRRGCELLKHFAQTGTVELSELRPWEPETRKPRQSVELDMPTPEQQADPDDLFALIWRVKQELHRAGLAQSTIHHYTSEGFSIILRKHKQHGLEHYVKSLANDLVAKARNDYEEGRTARVAYQNLRKASFLLSEMHRTGKISLTKIPNWGLREPVSQFADLLRHFCDNAIQTGILAGSSVNTAKSAIRGFLFELETCGRDSFECIALAEVSDAITRMARRYTGGLSSATFSIRIFLRHLYECGFTSTNLSVSVPELISRRKMFHEGFSDEETIRLLEEPDRTTALGKRDYAMMLLAAQTGLRACDVVSLKRENIDWRAGEIHIVQRKTGKPLSLPLEPESGNAIAEYLLHARPESALPYVFLCHTGIRRPVDNRSASAMVTKYLRRAKMSLFLPRRGFHSFRRSFGTRLLQNEIPIELLQQLLGHTHIDSMKPYLSVDEQGLKNCALSLVSCGKPGDLT